VHIARDWNPFEEGTVLFAGYCKEETQSRAYSARLESIWRGQEGNLQDGDGCRKKRATLSADRLFTDRSYLSVFVCICPCFIFLSNAVIGNVWGQRCPHVASFRCHIYSRVRNQTDLLVKVSVAGAHAEVPHDCVQHCKTNSIELWQAPSHG
jgi:hypothetical protein